MISNNKLQSLDSESLENVSGGYTETKYNSSDYSSSTIVVHCDNCGCEHAVPIGGLNGGHLCIECMKKIREELGDDALKSILKKS